MVAGRRSKHEVSLWAYEKEVCDGLTQSHVNSLFLPGFSVPGSVRATNDLKEALSGAEIVVSVMPSHHCRRTFEHMAQWLLPNMLFVSATKGVENDTLLRMSEVIHEVVSRFSGFQPRIAAISGPSFAKEVAKGDPTALTAASGDISLSGIVQKEFSDPAFRVYTNDDLVGVALGQGKQLQQIIAGMHGMVAEGVLTTNAAIGLAKKHKVEMPITQQMYAILHDGKSPHDAIRELMTRPGKVEDRF